MSAVGGHLRQGGSPLRFLVLLLVFGVLAGAVAAAAFGGHDQQSSGVGVVLLGTAAAKATQTVAASSAPASETDATATPAPPAVINGFSYPIPGACLPSSDNLMPGAPRAYRNGIHEGVDFYNSDNCTQIDVGTDVLAAKGGIVIRADWSYQDITAEEANALEADARFNGDNPQIEDLFRGRQVWIDHGDGVVTRYGHLSGIAQGIDVGTEVTPGQLLGYVGESGTPESTTAPGTEYHLHFEIRVGDRYLGQGLPPEDVRRLYRQAFSP